MAPAATPWSFFLSGSKGRKLNWRLTKRGEEKLVRRCERDHFPPMTRKVGDEELEVFYP